MSNLQPHSPRFGNAVSSFATTVTSHIHPGHEHASQKFFPSLADEFRAFETEFGSAPVQTSTQTKLTANYSAPPAYNITPNAQPAIIHQDAYTTLHPTVIQQDAFTTLQPKGAYSQSAAIPQQATMPNVLQNNIIQQAPMSNPVQENIANPRLQGQSGHITNYAQAPIYIPGYISKSTFMRKNPLYLNNNNLAIGAFSPGKKSKIAIVTKDVAAIGGPAAVAGLAMGTKIGAVGTAFTVGSDHGAFAITGATLGLISGIVGAIGAIGKSGFDIHRNKKAYLEEIARIKDTALATGKIGLVKGQWKFSPSGSSRRANDRTAEEINRDLSQGVGIADNKVYRLKMPNGRKTMSVYVPGAQEAQKYLARTNG